MGSFAEDMADMLRKGRFNEITLDQWESILLSIIVDHIEAEAAYHHRKPPAWTEGIPRVYMSNTLRFLARDSGELVASTMFLRKTLPTASRLVVCEALTRLIKNAYDSLKQSGYAKGQAQTTVDVGLSISSLLEGALRADVAEEMALDTKFHDRGAVLSNLLRQRFRNNASPAFWQKIEDQVSSTPQLAPYVMDQHLYHDNPVPALKVLRYVPEEPVNSNMVRIVEQALTDLQNYGGWEDQVRRVFRELPEWVLAMLRENVELNPLFREVIDLLETSSV